jgi:hypothetical protein
MENRVQHVIGVIDKVVRRPHTQRPPCELWRPGTEHLHEMQPEPMECSFVLYEEDGKTPIKAFKKQFLNWGRTVAFQPSYIFQPNTPGGVEHIVQWAKKNGKRVRVIGYQHSWTNLFGENGDVLISLFSIRVAESYPASHPPYDPEGNVFERIELLEEREIDGQKYGFLKLGAGVTNYQLREWTHQNQFSDGSRYYFPLNVVLTEITIGGSTAASCHGAGFNNKTISDLVVELEFVNVHGVRQTVKGPEAREFIGQTKEKQDNVGSLAIHTAAGSFGLLGVVLCLTFKLEPMKYARMNPFKRKVEHTIPPPVDRKRFPLPQHMEENSPKSEELWKDFMITAGASDYSEWFWFASHRECWVNCWNAQSSVPENCEFYPTRVEGWIQEKEVVLGQEFFNSEFLRQFPPEFIAKIFSKWFLSLLFFILSLCVCFVCCCSFFSSEIILCLSVSPFVIILY